jgi:hypothetical protein
MFNYEYVPFSECFKHISSELSNEEIIDAMIEQGYLIPDKRPKDIHLRNETFKYLPDEVGDEILYIRRDDLGTICKKVFQHNKKRNDEVL